MLVEEEGWLDDGRALAVDGAAPTRTGDAGFWFLVEVDDPDLPVFTTVGAAGRYLVDRTAGWRAPTTTTPSSPSSPPETPDDLASAIRTAA